MFDTIGAFKRQFTACEGGYLVYPSRKAGGRFVTEAEYSRLVGDWERAAGRAGRWKIFGCVLVIIAVWTLLAELLSPPPWGETLLIGLIVVAVSAWLLWVSMAPRRLVRDRAAVGPPRPPAEARREARASLNWPFIIFALLISGVIFVGSVTAANRTVSTWAWLIGSGTMLALYVWIGYKKLLDQRR